MNARTVLVTGPGGAGRSTAAAATAVRAARAGTRTLLLVGDDGPGAPDGGAPLGRPVPADGAVEVEPRLTVARYGPRPGGDDPAALAHVAAELLGVRPLDGDEFTALPGAVEAALLRALRRHATDPRWELLVVDCPPLPTTLTALALPERLHRHLDRLLPARRRAARALHPLLGALSGAPVPEERLYTLADRARLALAGAERVIGDDATTVHLVVDPRRAAHTLHRARPALALFGHRLETVLADGVLPAGSSDPWVAGLRRAQREQLDAVAATGVPLRELPHLGRDPAGPDDLAALGAALTVRERPGGRAGDPWTVLPAAADDTGATGTSTGELTWRLPLPGAARDDLALRRRDDELVVDLGPFRRILPLPSALRRCTATGATVRDGALLVRFVPDPGLWPRRETVG